MGMVRPWLALIKNGSVNTERKERKKGRTNERTKKRTEERTKGQKLRTPIFGRPFGIINSDLGPPGLVWPLGYFGTEALEHLWVPNTG